MRSGKTPQEACEALCQRIIDINGGTKNINFNDKIVALGKDGSVGCASIKRKKEIIPNLHIGQMKDLKCIKVLI